MLARWIFAAAPLLLLACTDPPPRVACAATDCRAKACGTTECGVVCAAGSGCIETHAVDGRLTGGGGAATAAGGHALAGCIETAGGGAASVGGHFVSHGSLTP